MKNYGNINSLKKKDKNSKESQAGIYDLLLLDIRMPDMNGYELYQKIRDIDYKAEVCL